MRFLLARRTGQTHICNRSGAIRSGDRVAGAYVQAPRQRRRRVLPTHVFTARSPFFLNRVNTLVRQHFRDVIDREAGLEAGIFRRSIIIRL